MLFRYYMHSDVFSKFRSSTDLPMTDTWWSLHRHDNSPSSSDCFFFQDSLSLTPTTQGRIASYYYLHHSTVKMFIDSIKHSTSLEELLKVLAVSVPLIFPCFSEENASELQEYLEGILLFGCFHTWVIWVEGSLLLIQWSLVQYTSEH